MGMMHSTSGRGGFAAADADGSTEGASEGMSIEDFRRAVDALTAGAASRAPRDGANPAPVEEWVRQSPPSDDEAARNDTVLTTANVADDTKSTCVATVPSVQPQDGEANPATVDVVKRGCNDADPLPPLQ